MNTGGIILTEKDRNTRRKIRLNATLSTTYPTWTDLGSNMLLRD
jgi:hypothetical protein